MKAGLLILILLSSSYNLNSIFQKAVQNYNSGNYEESYVLFQSLLEEGVKNPFIYYNLGNCAYRLGKLGEAIFRYRQALLLSPHFHDLTFNLKIAREKVIDRFEESYWRRFKKHIIKYFLLSPHLAWILFLSVNSILWIYLSINLFFKKAGKALIFLFIFYLYSSLTMVFTFYQIYFKKDGVIVEPVGRVYSGTDIGSLVLFELHEGTEVEILNERGEWVAIMVPDGRKGWMKKGSVKIVQEELK